MQNSFKNKKFLVTGCAGFIGSHVTEALLNQGAKVFGIDNFSTGSKQNIQHLFKNNHFKFTNGDFCHKKVIEQLIFVDYIYHGAVRGIGLSTNNPMLELKVNIQGTLQLLELMRKAKVKMLIFASSASVYGNPKHLPEKETDPCLPLSPYGVSKLAAEQYVIVYYHLYGLPVVALRYFNVYGPRQRWDSIYGGVVSIFLHSALKNIPLPVYGDGKQTRDFTYIDDVVKATISAFEKKEALGKVINIASGREHSILELAKVVKKISGKEKLQIKFTKRRLIDNINRRFGDISLAKKLLGYTPSVDLEEGLKKTYDWWSK